MKPIEKRYWILMVVHQKVALTYRFDGFKPENKLNQAITVQSVLVKNGQKDDVARKLAFIGYTEWIGFDSLIEREIGRAHV